MNLCRFITIAATTNLGIGAACDEINERRYCARNLVCHKCLGDSYYTCVQCMYPTSMYRLPSYLTFFLSYFKQFLLKFSSLIKSIRSTGSSVQVFMFFGTRLSLGINSVKTVHSLDIFCLGTTFGLSSLHK